MQSSEEQQQDEELLIINSKNMEISTTASFNLNYTLNPKQYKNSRKIKIEQQSKNNEQQQRQRKLDDSNKQAERINKLKQLLNANDTVRLNFINRNQNFRLINLRPQKQLFKNKMIRMTPIVSTVDNINNQAQHLKSQSLQQKRLNNHKTSIKKVKSHWLKKQKSQQKQLLSSKISLQSINIGYSKNKQNQQRALIKQQKYLIKLNPQSNSNGSLQTCRKRTSLFCKCEKKHIISDKNVSLPVIAQIEHIPQIKFRTKQKCLTSKNTINSYSPQAYGSSKYVRQQKNKNASELFQQTVLRNSQLELITETNTKYELKQKARMKQKRINQIKFKKSQNKILDFIY